MYIFFFFVLIVLFSSFVTVKQGTIAVVTVFGKYRRQLRPGLNFKIDIGLILRHRLKRQLY